MNVFEGARRISVVIAAAGAFATLLAIHHDKPRIVIPYQIRNVGLPPVQIDGCDESGNDAMESFTRWTPQGEEYRVELCFPASPSRDGRMLVPFQEGIGEILMNTKNSDQVRDYVRTTTERFEVSGTHIEEVARIISHKKSMHYVRGIAYVALGLLVFWMLVSIIGWIVRGFAGIPTGRDTKAG